MSRLSPDRKRVLSRRIFRYTVLAFLIVWPWYGNPFVLLGDANLAMIYTVIAASLVLLTGWVGQISLAQASFVGIGAFSAALLAEHLRLGFPVSLVVGGAVAAAAALLLGIVALRVRGLYLAVTTLIFAWICDSYVFLLPAVGGGSALRVPAKTVGTPGAFPYFDFTNRRTFYYVALGITAMVLFALANLRDSKTGRALFAVKGSEVAAASLAVNVTRYKLLAFGLSGFIAGMAGSLIAVYQGALSPPQFRFTVSLFYLAIPVLGGLRSLNGAVAAACIFGLLSDIFYRTPALNGYLDLVSALLLVAVLLAYPGGLAAAPDSLRRVLARRRQARLAAGLQPSRLSVLLDRWSPARTAASRRMSGLASSTGRRATALRSTISTRLGRPAPSTATSVRPQSLPLESFGLGVAEEPADAEPSSNGSSNAPLVKAGARRRPVGPRASRARLLAAHGITVRFGGLTAVNDVSLAVHEGEIVGLIGPNGAGKTTLFNAIAGLNSPTTGTVAIYDVDATKLPVHARAELGVARTFQAIQLLPELTVFDNLMVATHTQNPTGFLAHIALTRKAIAAEHECRALARQVVHMLGLDDVASRPCAGLPFGTLRMVEVARALVTRSPLVMLDEPASGLDNAETDRLAELLFWLQGELGVTVLLIEHDVKLVTSVCDYVYVIDRGNLIAGGVTEEIQRNPQVIAAYLGKADGTGAPPASPRPRRRRSSRQEALA